MIQAYLYSQTGVQPFESNPIPSDLLRPEDLRPEDIADKTPPDFGTREFFKELSSSAILEHVKDAYNLSVPDYYRVGDLLDTPLSNYFMGKERIAQLLKEGVDEIASRDYRDLDNEEASTVAQILLSARAILAHGI